MPFLYDIKKAIHTLLFLISCIGGKSELFRLGAMLYLADLLHLSRYGTLISGESYIALKNGPIPLGLVNIYKQCKGGSVLRSMVYTLSEYFKIDEIGNIVCISQYDNEYLAKSEVECLFETIQENKNLTFDALCEKVKNQAWADSSESGEIQIIAMAKSAGATDEMIKYIEFTLNNELQSFNFE